MNLKNVWKNNSCTNHPSNHSLIYMNLMENIVVIGIGVVRLSCAYSLLKSGKKVLLLEIDLPGCGQSTRTGGGIRYLNGP